MIKNKLNNNNLNIFIVYILMNLYTLPENQQLIWDTISKVPNFQQMRNSSPQKSEQWFRDIIQMYYNKHKQTIVDKNSLSQLNKETIRYMLLNLKEKNSFQPTSFQPNSSQNEYQNNYSILETNSNETRNFILEQKQNKLNNDFQLRQQEYTSLFEKPKIDEIDFRENMTEDKPIENMEELIKRQMAEREYDIQISNPTEKVDLKKDIVELDEKKVTFQDEKSDSYDNKIEALNNKIENFIEEFTEKLVEIQNEIKEIKKNQKTIQVENDAIQNAEKIISKLRNIEKPLENNKIIQEHVNS